MNDKKIIFSGIQPSGNLHLGNYLGAIKNWVTLQDEYQSIFCVVDLHAITVPQDPAKLRQKTLEIAKIYLAAGIDPTKSTIFIQSHIPQHAELMWILNTIAKTGELFRMTQFKDKSGIDKDLMERNTKILNKQIKILQGSITKEQDKLLLSEQEVDTLVDTMQEFVESLELEIKNRNIGAGIMNYPVLMAADIILYDTQLVPVGKDQMQHVELARTLARRFNEKFGETFVVPESYVKKEGMNIMGLDNPEKKMSKSASTEYNYISLVDDEEAVRRKIKKAVTDSGAEIVYSDDKPAIKNLLNIYSLLSDQSTDEIVKKYAGKGYGDFKADLAEVIIGFLKPFQEKYNSISDEETLRILKDGAEKLRPMAEKKIREVKEKVGFIL